MTSKADVIVQCPEQTDFAFISGLNCNLKPVNMGSLDWIDSELFAPPEGDSAREYDLIMVANWAEHKNHRRLFGVLQHVKTLEAMNYRRWRGSTGSTAVGY